MTGEELFVGLYGRGVRLDLTPAGLRYRAPKGVLTSELRAALRDHKAGLVAFLTPDETLPDEIIIPASCPNDEEAIKACVDRQRKGRVAA